MKLWNWFCYTIEERRSETQRALSNWNFWSGESEGRANSNAEYWQSVYNTELLKETFPTG